MSGLVGTIISISKGFNDIGTNSTVEGIKMANYLNGRIATAEKEQPKNELKQEDNLEPRNLVEDIQQDMEDNRER